MPAPRRLSLVRIAFFAPPLAVAYALASLATLADGPAYAEPSSSSVVVRAARDAGGDDAAAPLDAGPSDAGLPDAAYVAWLARRAAPISSIPPDPPPMRERFQWVFDLRYERGDVYLVGVRRVDGRKAEETPRAMGRFALELFEGPTLIERVRFDFPLLGAGAASVSFGGQGSG